MKHKLATLLFILLIPTSSYAQDDSVRSALKWPSHEKLADGISTGLVAVSLVSNCLGNWNRKCFTNQALKVGIGVVAAEVVKRVVHRDRPDGSDNKSFFSEHTMLACTYQSWSLCPAVGYLRIAADKHWGSDVLAGAAVGVGLSFAFR